MVEDVLAAVGPIRVPKMAAKGLSSVFRRELPLVRPGLVRATRGLRSCQPQNVRPARRRGLQCRGGRGGGEGWFSGSGHIVLAQRERTGGDRLCPVSWCKVRSGLKRLDGGVSARHVPRESQ